MCVCICVLGSDPTDLTTSDRLAVKCPLMTLPSTFCSALQVMNVNKSMKKKMNEIRSVECITMAEYWKYDSFYLL